MQEIKNNVGAEPLVFRLGGGFSHHNGGGEVIRRRLGRRDAEGFEETLKFLQSIGCDVIQISAIGDIHPEVVAELVDKYKMDVCVTHKPYDRMKNDLDALIYEHDLIHCDNIGIGAMPGNVHESFEGVTGFIMKCNEIAEKINYLLQHPNVELDS